MSSNMFEVLKISNKELVLSNYFAWLLNPDEEHGQDKYFLKAFLSAVGIETVKDDDTVFVDREFSFILGGKTNYIDILLRFNSKENPSRVICIENKVDSEEGCNQTKRYYDGLQTLFPNCNNKQYIYLTRYNSSVALTKTEFKQVKYNQLMYMFRNSHGGIGVDNVPLTADFYAEYIYKDTKIFYPDEPVDLSEKDNFNILLDGLVYWLNKDTTDVFCAKGKSAQSGEGFCVIYKPDWVFSIPSYPDIEFCIHLEIVRKAIYLHFEIKPYIPYRKLQAKYSNEFLSCYDDLRESLRNAMFAMQPANSAYLEQKYKSNANLQIAKHKIIANEYYQFYQSLQELINDMSPVIQAFLSNQYTEKA